MRDCSRLRVRGVGISCLVAGIEDDSGGGRGKVRGQGLALAIFDPTLTAKSYMVLCRIRR